MARKKKQKQKKHTIAGPATAARVEKALRENRTQQALELAKTLYKQQATAQNKELLKQATLARGEDLAARGYNRDAATVFANVAALDASPDFQGQIAQKIARVGDISAALQMAQAVTDEAAKARIFAFVADEAIHQGPAAKAQLPPQLQGQIDLVLAAFAHAEKGEDDLAREKLNGIGLRSPFLEWKLFLRGLLAFYQNDDGRTLENWQRLDAERWPFRLAAPLRFTIDRPFAEQQSPQVQARLQKQTDRLMGTVLLEKLRLVQAAIGHEDQLPKAFRLAESVIHIMKTEAPHLIPRLASCFYWAIIHHGMPEDMGRYRRLFGSPADDPDLTRMEALALEVRGEMQVAHALWQKFQESVKSNPAWPIEQKNRVRALVWWHMGKNADTIPEIDRQMLPPFFSGMPMPNPLKPGAAECYEKSIELAPDQLATYEALMQHFLRKEDLKNAEKAGRRLVKQFPDHVPSLEKVGDILMEVEKHGEALKLYEKAMQGNPLDLKLRSKLAEAHAYHARHFAEKGDFDKAREGYQTALALDKRGQKYPILCKWAACEFKAGNAERGEELLQQAQSEQGTRLAVVFSILIETIRFKLNKLKKRFNDEFNQLLAQPPTADAAVSLADTASSHRAAGVNYYGQQTHEKKVLAYLEKALQADFTEQQLRTICDSLHHLKKPMLHLKYIQLGQQRFPKSPHFFLAEARYEFERGPYSANTWRMQTVLEQARQLLQQQPRSDEQQEMLKQIQVMETLVGTLNPFGRLFGGLGGSPFDFFDDMDDDDDYDDDDDDEYW